MFRSNNEIKDLKKNLDKSKVPEQLKQELFKLLKSDEVSEETITKIKKAINDPIEVGSNDSTTTGSTSDVLESVTKPKRVMVDKNKVIYKCSICDFRSRDKKAKCARHPLAKMTLWNQK